MYYKNICLLQKYKTICRKLVLMVCKDEYTQYKYEVECL